MQQYAVTVVFYINAQNEDESKMVVSQMIDETFLSRFHNESVDIVDTTEVKF